MGYYWRYITSPRTGGPERHQCWTALGHCVIQKACRKGLVHINLSSNTIETCVEATTQHKLHYYALFFGGGWGGGGGENPSKMLKPTVYFCIGSF